MKALDIVRTPKGAWGLVTETNDGGEVASISFFGGGNPTGERNAWYGHELEVIDNLPRILALAMANPSSQSGERDARDAYPI